MSVREINSQPHKMAHFPKNDGYRWVELHDDAGLYGHAACKKRDDALEIHLSLARWGPSVRRHVHTDKQWFINEAKRLGKKKIMGVRADTNGRFDNQLFRFARLFGFTDFCVLQTMSLNID